MLLRYSGTDKLGVYHFGATESETADQLVRRLYGAGWRKLSVIRNADGIEVGAIDRVRMRRGRAWWAEKTAGPAESTTEPAGDHRP